jgi:hypothetical protein
MIIKLHEVNPVVDQPQCTWRGSNSQPLDPKSSALSIELQVQLQIGCNYSLSCRKSVRPRSSETGGGRDPPATNRKQGSTDDG